MQEEMGMLLPILFTFLGKEADTHTDLGFTKRKNTKTMQNPQPTITGDYLPVYFQKNVPGIFDTLIIL